MILNQEKYQLFIDNCSHTIFLLSKELQKIKQSQQRRDFYCVNISSRILFELIDSFD